MAIDPVTMGLVMGGGQALGAIGNFFGGKAKARAQNKAIIAQYKQRMLIQRAQDLGRFNKYNARVQGFQDQVANQTQVARMESMQDQLKMDEMLKGMAFQGQNDAVNELTARGKIAARGVSGQSAMLAQQSVSAAIGRQAAARDEQMVGAALANRLREDARIQSLNAANKKAYNEVRYAPMKSLKMKAPQLASGPSALSLITGLGQAALSGVSAGMSQQNFLDGITSTPQTGTTA